jgi:hypothetical protein
LFIYDALLMLSNTINKNNLYESNYFDSISDISCDLETKWVFGQEFMNYLKNNHFIGLTGQVEFNKETNLRSGFELSIVDKITNLIYLVSVLFFLKIRS